MYTGGATPELRAVLGDLVSVNHRLTRLAAPSPATPIARGLAHPQRAARPRADAARRARAREPRHPAHHDQARAHAQRARLDPPHRRRRRRPGLADLADPEGLAALAAWRERARRRPRPHFADLDDDELETLAAPSRSCARRPRRARRRWRGGRVQKMTAAWESHHVRAGAGPQARARGIRRASILKQPKAVWAVAFACVVAFMGIGLVDPILPAIAESLQATPDRDRAALHQLPADHRPRHARHQLDLQPHRRQAHPAHRPRRSSWCSPCWPASRGTSSRSSASAPAGGSATRSSSRPRWRRSSARRRAAAARRSSCTRRRSASASRSVRCSAACSARSAGAARSSAPRRSWRSRSSRSSCCSARSDAARPDPTRLSAPLRALANPRSRVLAGDARCSTTSASSSCWPTRPFPLGIRRASALGLVVLRLGRRPGDHVGVGRAAAHRDGCAAPRVLAIVLPLLALDLVAAGLRLSHDPPVVACIVAGGLVLGVLNTVLTESVMEAHRPAALGRVDVLLGGALPRRRDRPAAAALLAALISPEAPYFVAAASVVVALAVVLVGHRRPAPRRRCARAGARRGRGHRGRRRGLRHPSAVSRAGTDRSARRARRATGRPAGWAAARPSRAAGRPSPRRGGAARRRPPAGPARRGTARRS